MTDGDGLGRYPRASGLAWLALRPREPLVMVNLLAFRAQATGSFQGMSGRQAYAVYAASAMAALTPRGSRLLWSGEVHSGPSHASPRFDAIAFLEYPSPQAFLRFALIGGADIRARRAGLRGQWLITATTLDQQPATPGPVLVELLTPADHAPTQHAHGTRVWHGRCHRRLIGSGPDITQVVATAFPDLAALTAAEQVQSSRRWTYRCTTTDPQAAHMR